MSNSTDGFIQPGRGPGPSRHLKKPEKRVELPGFKSQNQLNLGRRIPAQKVERVHKPLDTIRRPTAYKADITKPAATLGFSSYQPALAQMSKPTGMHTGLDTEKPKSKKRRFRSKRTFLRILLVIFLIGFGVGGYMGWKTYNSTGHVFRGSVFKAIFSAPKALKVDNHGRSNILIFGTSEDDPGHPGGDLTDSIMIASIDQNNHNAFIMSVPRDLWVTYPTRCAFGYSGKINVTYICGKGSNKDEAAGQKALRDVVGKVFGIDLQYSVHVDYKVLRDSVNALGGVDITIASSDPRGILDRNFDWRCKYKCYLVKYPNGPVHLTGEQALYLAQARGAAGGYGLPRGNFDREENQRKILLAAKDKASSIGFLSNPLSVTRLLDSLGNNVRTNFEAAEIKTLINVIKETNNSNVESVSLIDQQPALLTTGTGPDGTSIVRTTAGLTDYDGLQDFMHAYLTGKGPLLKEAASIDVLNATGVVGVATKEADKLTSDGLKVGYIGNTPTGNYGKIKLYDLSKGSKPKTKAELENFLGVTSSTDALPTGYTTTASFVVIIGVDPSASSSSNSSN